MNWIKSTVYAIIELSALFGLMALTLVGFPLLLWWMIS